MKVGIFSWTANSSTFILNKLLCEPIKKEVSNLLLESFKISKNFNKHKNLTHSKAVYDISTAYMFGNIVAFTTLLRRKRLLFSHGFFRVASEHSRDSTSKKEISLGAVSIYLWIIVPC